MASPTRSALAAIVRLGLTPPPVGRNDASTTNRFSTPRRRHQGSSGAVFGSSPKRTVPAAWEKVVMWWV